MPTRSKQPSDNVFLRAGKLRPPAALPPAAKAIWLGIMSETPEQQWRKGDAPMLGAFCRVAVLVSEALDHLEREGQVDAAGKVSVWSKAAHDHAKTLALLGSKLRIVPSSRIRPEEHSLQQHPALGRPWNPDDDELLARPM